MPRIGMLRVMDAHFTLQCCIEGPVLVVVLTGQLDVAGAPRLRSTLRRGEQGGIAEVVVDLARLDFVDAAGLGVLAGASRRLQAAGVQMSLASPRCSTVRVLRLVGLDRVLPIAMAVERLFVGPAHAPDGRATTDQAAWTAPEGVAGSEPDGDPIGGLAVIASAWIPLACGAAQSGGIDRP